MKREKMTCDEIALKIMALVDDELSEQEKKSVLDHIAVCDRCAAEYASLKKLKNVTGEMKMKKLPEFYWDEYWGNVYNRFERGFSWILISIGVIIVLGFLVWDILGQLIADPVMNPLLKGGIYLLILGVVVLLVSIIREKLMVRKVDKYNEVER